MASAMGEGTSHVDRQMTLKEDCKRGRGNRDGRSGMDVFPEILIS